MDFSNIKENLSKMGEDAKEAFTKAGSAIEKFGNDSKNKIDILQAESEIKSNYVKLGEEIYKFHKNGYGMANLSDVVIENILKKIDELNKVISEKENEIKTK